MHIEWSHTQCSEFFKIVSNNGSIFEKFKWHKISVCAIEWIEYYSNKISRNFGRCKRTLRIFVKNPTPFGWIVSCSDPQTIGMNNGSEWTNIVFCGTLYDDGFGHCGIWFKFEGIWHCVFGWIINGNFGHGVRWIVSASDDGAMIKTFGGGNFNQTGWLVGYFFVGSVTNCSAIKNTGNSGSSNNGGLRGWKDGEGDFHGY